MLVILRYSLPLILKPETRPDAKSALGEGSAEHSKSSEQKNDSIIVFGVLVRNVVLTIC